MNHCVSTFNNRKPKVLFIASNIPTPKRKSNKVVMTIAHKLSKWFDVSVMHPTEFAPFPINLINKYKSIAGKQSWDDNGISVQPFRYIRLFSKRNAFLLLPWYKRRIKQFIERFGIPELVHAHFALPDGYFAYLTSKIYNIPYIISFRGSDMKLLKQPGNCNTAIMMRRVLANARQIIVHNMAQQEALSNIGFKSVLFAHGIEVSFFKEKNTINRTNNIVIATIGELIPQKHIDWVVKAVTNYAGRKNLILKIAGEGPSRPELEALAHGRNIQLLGKIGHDKIGELLGQTDIFALPSINETFGLVYLEAAAHQNAVIATKGTGIWGHFLDGEEVLYCDSYTSFQKMLYELIDDDDLRNEMASKAYKKTKNSFTWEAVIDKYVSIYRPFLQQS